MEGLLCVTLLVIVGCNSVMSLLSAKAQADQDYIFDGVRTIRADPGHTALISVFGDSAFPLVAGKNDDGVFSPLAAGGTFGKGRLVGFARGEFLKFEGTNPAGGPTDHNRFLLNLHKWLAGGKHPNVAAFVGGPHDYPPEILRRNNVKVNFFSLQELSNTTTLKEYDVVVIREYITPNHLPLLQNYLNSGGGILAAFNTWYWMSYVGVKGEFAPNILARNFGFAWRNDDVSLRSVVPDPHGIFNVTYPALANLTFSELWDSVKAAKMQPATDNPLRLLHAFVQNSLGVPKDFFHDNLNFYIEVLSMTRPEFQPVPTNENPVSTDSDKYKLLLFDYFTTYVLKPEDVVAHPSSIYFPGAPAKATTETQVLWHNITLNKGRSALYSTGLYAPAGKVVVVKLVEHSSPEAPKIELRIGSGFKYIDYTVEWLRANMRIREIKFQNGTATFNTPYGGPIYIEAFVDTHKGESTSIVLVTSGAISAPYFKLGETSVQEWSEKIRFEPGPWTELVTENIILSVPSDAIRTLENPELVLEVWAKAADAFADLLLLLPHERPVPQRIFFDVQPPCYGCTSAGTGEVVYFLLPVSQMAVSLTFMLSIASRGFWWNMAIQYNSNTFLFNRSILGQATLNLFALYIFDKLMGLRPGQANRSLTPPYYQPRIRGYLERHRNMTILADEPWIALVYYVQLQEKYGWEIFQETFSEYRRLPSDQKPDDIIGSMKSWVLTLSKTVEQNLGDFHKSWGFPLDQEFSAQLSSLKFPMDPMRMEDLL